MGGFLENLYGGALIKACAEILIIFVLLYTILRIMQGTRGTGILRGLAFILVIIAIVILFFIKKLELYTVDWLITEFLPVFIIPIIILFQSEFRRALIKVGQSRLFRVFFSSEVLVVQELVTAILSLSNNKIGALFAIECEDGLDHYIESGIRINSDVSSDLISTIFWPGTPLHDGAVIIQEQKIVAAGCLFPLTESDSIAKTFGTRHRAGIGITEETDAISVIVSEETGGISISVRGQLQKDLNQDELKQALEKLATVGVLSTQG
ncbi:MAG: TIGR00159 family protein [Planctomycetes bacterium]|nr:TIGR00159 family protein [Planctomycetota bacterium]